MEEDFERRFCFNHQRHTMHIILQGEGCLAKLCCLCVAEFYTKTIGVDNAKQALQTAATKANPSTIEAERQVIPTS